MGEQARGARSGQVREGPEGWEDERRSVRSYVLVRAAALVPAAGLALTGDDELDGLFWLVLALAAALAAAGTVLAFSAAWRRVPPERSVPLDVVVVGGLLATSGGAGSDLRTLALISMVAPAIVLPPRTVLLSGLGLVVVYLAAALPDVAQGEEHAGQAVLSFLLGMAWVTGAAAVLSAIRTAGAARVLGLTRAQQRLLTGVLESEERQRRRITRDLHEGPLQHLLAARQDLEEARGGDQEALDLGERGIVSAVRLIRETIADVHPVALDHGGLAAGLRALAERGEAAGGFRSAVMVEPAAEGLRDEVLVSITRELVANAAEHASAEHLEVRVAVAGPELLLDVRDDGRGFDPALPAEDRVGLATCRERAAAAGGRLVLSSEPGGGTHVRVRLPVLARRASDAHDAAAGAVR